MKTHTSGYKNSISTLGRELDSKITFTINGDTTELGSEELNSISVHYEGDILKSVMKQLDIDSNVEIPEGTEVNYQFGVKVNGSYEYLDYGNFIVYKVEKQEDYDSWRIICYDKMLLSMVNYERIMQFQLTSDVTFTDDKNYYNDDYTLYTGERTGNPSTIGLYECIPMTIREFIGAICTTLGITFANSSDTFTNYDKQLESELFVDSNGGSLGYTYRDVLDQLAQVTASTICINDDDELEIRYITSTNDTIDEEFLKDVNVSFGKKYGPINSVVLSRSAGSDNIYEQDAGSIALNGLCELKIEDNQIMNGNDRDTYLSGIFTRLNGLEYYTNDYSSPGITYYDLCDRYNITVGNTTYSCVMLNDEILITQGLEENIYTDMPETTETDYKSSSDTDRKINQAYLIVDKVNGEITGVISKTNQLDVTVNNNYQELINKFGDYAPQSSVVSLQTSVTQMQTNTYTKTQIDTMMVDGTVKKLHTTSATFDENGMTYDKTGSRTISTINEDGLNVRIKNDDETPGNSIMFAGYVDANNTQYHNYEGKTIVATENILVDDWLVVGKHSRFEDYEPDSNTNGTGCFYIG